MAERSDHERRMAAAERELAARDRNRATAALTDDEREALQRSAWHHDEAADLHEYLANVYDRQDASRR